MRLQFGDCVFDSDTRQVLREDGPLPLTPKAFQLLEVLIAQRPHAVSKHRLQEELWPDAFVVEANLANLVAALRSALGDDARRPRLIRTVQRFGYAFQAEATAVVHQGAHVSACRLVWNDREIALREGENLLGRDATAVAWLDSYGVSRRHALLLVSAEATIQDLASKNGTSVNDKPVSGVTSLQDGDVIRLGRVELVFRRFRPGVSTQTD